MPANPLTWLGVPPRSGWHFSWVICRGQLFAASLNCCSVVCACIFAAILSLLDLSRYARLLWHTATCCPWSRFKAGPLERSGVVRRDRPARAFTMYCTMVGPCALLDVVRWWCWKFDLWISPIGADGDDLRNSAACLPVPWTHRIMSPPSMSLPS